MLTSPAGVNIVKTNDYPAPRYRHLQQSLNEHLARWFKPDGSLVYENLEGKPVENRISGIGSTLPFAVLAWKQPKHAALEPTLQFWQEREKRDPDGCIIDRSTMTTRPHHFLLFAIALLSSFGMWSSPFAAATPPNVLFIAVDDLNCRIGCYGDEIARTPNLDRLAARGVRFDRAYCQFPLCNATRGSVLSGRYPTTTGVLDNFTWLVLPDGIETLLPTRFEKSGYAVSLNGKIFHVTNTGFRPGDAAISSTDDPWLTPDERRQQQREHPNPPAGFFLDARAMTPEAERYTAANRYGALPPSDAGTDVPIADAAIADLRRFAKGEGPFFLGVGFKKPHVPLLAPQEFLDLYAAADIPLPPDFDTSPRGGNGMPPEEFRGNRDLFSGRAFSRDEAREAIRCYYACISYMDRQLGRVLDELDRLDLTKDTVIVLWGDHGWHLSEKGLWAKDTLFEASARGPLIIVDPRYAATAGKSSPRVVQYLDLYPTLLDLCGLPRPDFLEGVSLVPLLENPEAVWDRPAYTVQTRGWSLGRSLRTERWRYTEWDAEGMSRALFDHEADPHELRNLAHDPTYTDVVARLREQLRNSPVSTSEFSQPQP